MPREGAERERERERGEGTYLKTIYNISGCFYCCKLRDVVSDNLPNAELRSQLNDNFNGCGAIVVVILFVLLTVSVCWCAHTVSNANVSSILKFLLPLFHAPSVQLACMLACLADCNPAWLPGCLSSYWSLVLLLHSILQWRISLFK